MPYYFITKNTTFSNLKHLHHYKTTIVREQMEKLLCQWSSMSFPRRRIQHQPATFRKIQSSCSDTERAFFEEIS